MKSIESAKILYENLEYIGEGTSGTIYRALRRGLKQHRGHIVALKILKSKKAFQELAHEYESLLKIESPYILKIFSLEETALGPALVMEYSDGVNLYELWKKSFLSADVLSSVLVQLQEALRDFHARQLFHGDLNLKNILISPQGRVKLIDFGNSFDKNQGQRATTLFAAPECLAGDPQGILSDLYSLAKMEEFLSQGQSQMFTQNLQRVASAREFFSLSNNGDHKKLAHAVSICISEKIGMHTQQLASSHVVKPARWKEVCLFAAFFILPNNFAIPEAQQVQSLYKIEVRSKNWMEISVNGKYLGFTPLKITTHEKNLRIQWKNASGSGETKYFLTSSEKILTEAELFQP